MANTPIPEVARSPGVRWKTRRFLPGLAPTHGPRLLEAMSEVAL